MSYSSSVLMPVWGFLSLHKDVTSIINNIAKMFRVKTKSLSQSSSFHHVATAGSKRPADLTTVSVSVHSSIPMGHCGDAAMRNATLGPIRNRWCDCTTPPMLLS